jgi:hypothetical protein
MEPERTGHAPAHTYTLRAAPAASPAARARARTHTHTHTHTHTRTRTRGHTRTRAPPPRSAGGDGRRPAAVERARPAWCLGHRVGRDRHHRHAKHNIGHTEAMLRDIWNGRALRLQGPAGRPDRLPRWQPADAGRDGGRRRGARAGAGAAARGRRGRVRVAGGRVCAGPVRPGDGLPRVLQKGGRQGVDARGAARARPGRPSLQGERDGAWRAVGFRGRVGADRGGGPVPLPAACAPAACSTNHCRARWSPPLPPQLVELVWEAPQVVLSWVVVLSHLTVLQLTRIPFSTVGAVKNVVSGVSGLASLTLGALGAPPSPPRAARAGPAPRGRSARACACRAAAHPRPRPSLLHAASHHPHVLPAHIPRRRPPAPPRPTIHASRPPPHHTHTHKKSSCASIR